MVFIANLLPFNALLGCFMFPWGSVLLSVRNRAGVLFAHSVTQVYGCTMSEEGEEKSHVGLFLSPSQRGKFPFLRVSPPVIFHWPFSYHTQQIAWGLEHEKVEKIIKGKVDFSPFSVLRPPFLTSWTKIRVLFQELFVCTWVPLLGFLLQCVQAGDYSSGGKKMVNLLLIWCCFELWFSQRACYYLPFSVLR